MLIFHIRIFESSYIILTLSRSSHGIDTKNNINKYHLEKDYRIDTRSTNPCTVFKITATLLVFRLDIAINITSLIFIPLLQHLQKKTADLLSTV